jgi:hypothetical protein
MPSGSFSARRTRKISGWTAITSRFGAEHVAGFVVDRDHLCRTAAAGDPELSAWISSQTPPQSD